MNYLKTLIFFLLIINVLQAQNENKYAGFLKIQDTLMIKYKIEFKEDNGKIKGYSYTDFGGEHETKSIIEGEFNENNKELSFSEVGMVYTKSPVSLEDFDFCNVHLEATKFKLGSDKLMGNFKGKFSDGTQCINGEIAMNSVEKINKRVAKFSKKVENSKKFDEDTKNKVRNLKILDSTNVNILKNNQTTSFFTKSSSLELHIYDGGQVDNDIISILKNDKIILYKYSIKKDKKIIKIPLDDKKTRLDIIAISKGTIGSNTVVIEIVDNTVTTKTMTSLQEGEITKVDIIKN